jgi:general secretion pathway protein K
MLDGTEHRLKLAAGEVRIQLFDENAKINPNHASDVLLAALFESAGVERIRARRLGAAVADWVGPDMTPRPLGAKLEQYRQAGLSYGPPNTPIESLDELQLVLGMTPEIFAAVRPYLSIYADKVEPDPQNASAVVQRALIIAARQKPADDSGDASDAPEPPASNASDPGAEPPVAAPGAATPVPENSSSAAEKEPDGAIVSIEVVAEATGGAVFVRRAVLQLDPANAKGYAVLDWRRGDLAASD